MTDFDWVNERKAHCPTCEISWNSERQGLTCWYCGNTGKSGPVPHIQKVA